MTDTIQAQKNLQARNVVLEKLARSAPLDEVLLSLVQSVESANPEVLCSILLLDEQPRQLRVGSAPSLPNFYNRAIDGLVIGPGVGCCGSAAHTGERVVVEDVMTHPFWQDYRELCAYAGLRACWSEPIKSSTSHVLGTFALYYREPRAPDEADVQHIRTVAQVAGIATERKRDEQRIAHYQKQLQSMSFELMIAEDRERRRVATDLHDGLGQTLTLARMKLGAMRQAEPDEERHAALQIINGLVDEALHSVRTLTFELSPPVLHELGLLSAVKWLAGDVKERYGLALVPTQKRLLVVPGGCPPFPLPATRYSLLVLRIPHHPGFSVQTSLSFGWRIRSASFCGFVNCC